MGKTDEQFAKLEGFIEELSIQADKSEVVNEKSKQFMLAIGKIELNTPENFAIYRQSLKEYFSSDLEYYRDKIAIIRTISPETANYLESQVLKFEKTSLKIMRDLDNIEKYSFKKDLDESVKKDLDSMDETINLLPKQGSELWGLILLNYNFLQDILKFLRAE